MGDEEDGKRHVWWLQQGAATEREIWFEQPCRQQQGQGLFYVRQFAGNCKSDARKDCPLDAMRWCKRRITKAFCYRYVYHAAASVAANGGQSAVNNPPALASYDGTRHPPARGQSNAVGQIASNVQQAASGAQDVANRIVCVKEAADTPSRPLISF